MTGWSQVHEKEQMDQEHDQAVHNSENPEDVEVDDPGLLEIMSRAWHHTTGGTLSAPEVSPYPDRPHLCQKQGCEQKYLAWEKTCLDMVDKERRKETEKQEIYDTLTTVVLGALVGLLLGVLHD